MRRAATAAVAALLGLASLAMPATAASSEQQLAHSGVLIASDFPAGWTETARSSASDAPLDSATAKVAACKPFVAFIKDEHRHPRADSGNFEHEHVNVTNRVTVYPSSAKADAALRTLSDPRLPACLDALSRSEFARQLKKTSPLADHIASVDVSAQLVPDVRIGDRAVAYQGPIEVRLDDGTTQSIQFGVASVRVGQAVAGYTWTSDGDISSTLQAAIVKSVTRLQDAQSAT